MYTGMESWPQEEGRIVLCWAMPRPATFVQRLVRVHVEFELVTLQWYEARGWVLVSFLFQV